MAEQKQQRAEAVFAEICAFMKKDGWRCEIGNDLHLVTNAKGEDLPIELHVTVDAQMEVIVAFSFLPVEVPEDKRLDMAVAVSVINNKLAFGCFEFDVTRGDLLYSLVNSFSDTNLSEDVYTYLLYGTCQVVDRYNDTLLMLSKGLITLEQFLQKEMN